MNILVAAARLALPASGPAVASSSRTVARVLRLLRKDDPLTALVSPRRLAQADRYALRIPDWYAGQRPLVAPPGWPPAAARAAARQIARTKAVGPGILEITGTRRINFCVTCVS